MRLRSLAGATLFVLQALVAGRPFVALSASDTSLRTAGTHAAHVAPAAHACHDEAAGDASATPAGRTDAHLAHTAVTPDVIPESDATPSHGALPEAPPSHDHNDGGCHAGTPCCAPAVPDASVTLPTAVERFLTGAHGAPRDVSHVAESIRRQPPATAPPLVG